MNEEFDSNSRIDAELQVRLMNLVMGEASDFERDQLQAMMEERAELAAYYQHLEHLHGLLREVGSGEPSLEAEVSGSADAWQLPADRREKLLTVLDGKVEEPITPVRLASSVSAKLKPYLTRRWLSGLAVAAASLLLGIVIFPRSRLAKEQFLSQRANVSFAGGSEQSLHLTEGLMAEATASQGYRMSRRNSQFELEQRTSGITSAPMPRTAESAATSSLPSPYYLTDDVQYYPSSRPSAAATPSVGQPGVQPAAPATDANNNGTITFGRGGELSEWAKLSRGRLDQGGQVNMPDAGLSTAADAMPGKPGSSSSTETDGLSSLAGSAGELPVGGNFGGGDMGMGGMPGMGGAGGMGGGMGMGMAGGILSGMPSSGNGTSGYGSQLEAAKGREFAGAESSSGGAAHLFYSQGMGSGPADIKLESLSQQREKSDQDATVDFFDSGVRFGNVDKSESGAAAPNQPTSASDDIALLQNHGGVSAMDLSNSLARIQGPQGKQGQSSQWGANGTNASVGSQSSGESKSWSVDLPKSELTEFDRLDSKVDREGKNLAAITTVPDGGSMMLGGIIKNGSLDGSVRLSDDFGVPEGSIQTDTPRILFDKEEEARLGVADSPLVSEAELQASERRIDVSGDLFGANETDRYFGSGIPGAQDPDEKQQVVDGKLKGRMLIEPGSVNNPSAEQWQDQSAGGINLQDARGSGSAEKAQLESGQLGDVQIEVVDSVGAIIIKGSKPDVQRTWETIDQIKQQGQRQPAEEAKRAVDANADKSGPESHVNAEWFRKQVGGFQAASGKDNQEQLAELRKGLERPQDAPVVALDISTPALALGNTRTQSAETEKRFSEASSGNAGEKSEKLSSEVTEEFNTSGPVTASRESSRQMDGFDWAGKEAPSPEVAAAGRYAAPMAAGKATTSELAGAKPSSQKAAESKSEAKTESFEFANDKALSKKFADPKQLGLATAEPREQNSRRERRPSIDEQSAAKEAFSTFSLHVSDVSFKLAQTALSQGQWPEAAKIRIEEFVNALDYRDPLPGGYEKVSCRIEQAIHPFLIQRNLLRVSMRTAATGRSQNTPLRLTVLLDNSGSMERPDRRQAVLRAFQTLSAQLKASDQITLISFASSPRLLADKVPGNQGETLLQLIENLPSEGGTNIESALILAREKAAEQRLAGAQNRIVLLTDGAVNLGNANPDSLAKLVTGLRDSGIAFDAAGISAHDLNDEVLEALTRQGDGRYYLLDSAAAANESFAAQIAGALRPSAQNVKVQVEFNPQRVGRYKLLGFEKHRLNKEDFRNDKVDAAEMAAAEAGVAVYQFEIKPNGVGDVGSVSVRFRDLTTGRMIENRWPIPYESNAPRLEQAEPSMKLAACAALFAAKLSGGPLGDGVDLSQLRSLLAKLPEQIVSQPRVQQLRAMIEQASAIGR